MPSPRFIKSAVWPADYPPEQGVEIAIAGRSNAGKSSLINLLVTSRLAHVSATPGKTRLLNFFDISGKYVLVDMPGYGFASRSGDEQKQWQEMIEAYLMERQSLNGLLLVMDIRRKWTEDEELLKEFAGRRDIPFAVALTKADKLSRNEIQKAVAALKRQAQLSHLFPISSLKKTGHVELEEFVFSEWVKPHLRGGSK